MPLALAPRLMDSVTFYVPIGSYTTWDIDVMYPKGSTYVIRKINYVVSCDKLGGLPNLMISKPLKS
jgi:hypothetical protein